MENGKYGYLLRDDIKIARQQFKEAVRLIGINIFYRAPYKGKSYTTYGEIDSNYEPPIKIGCIFVEHPTQYTAKKIGWVSELQEGSSLVQVAYDLPNLQIGSLFILPQGIDDDNGRIFRVINLSNDMVYPDTVTCEIVPEFEDSIPKHQITDFTTESFNYISRDDEDED